ncbi:GntR family transcriptional regulator [Amorphoplanes nipponensis]|uniref:GntR family transcriptional regulator n=1 Tax=Actinoplanes nipponensis TaxID=135950 RepID=A0A919JF79_9ACTN|nr:GntR family transcriptional regulator [Actinoplanes nipponensis]GIE47922.1 GntR family transcriptional regulator [Actinoplanes nipponensis]
MQQEAPPYRRIADEVRRQVVAGELTPGDRVPSTRRLARDFGVAIATATKALAVLRQEGITVARPGVGTVVAPRATAARTRAPDGELSRQRIVRAAITLADGHGLGELSMRRVAAELGVATMSLYRHVPGKDELVLLMIDAALGEERLPAVRPAGWRAGLTVSTTLLWRLFRRHPWLAPAMSLTRPQPAPNGLLLVEWVLETLAPTRLDRRQRLYVHILLFSYARGIATALEPEAEARRETGVSSDEWMGSLAPPAGLTPEHLPHLAELVARDDFDLDLDLLFRFGLARLLDGLDGWLAGRG